MKAITVCVDYCDLLSITLAVNLHHFEKVLVVTSPEDIVTRRFIGEHFPSNIVSVFVTDAFYRHGAIFNKGLALEEGFDVLGRSDWICILDADILIPPYANLNFSDTNALYTPERRMLLDAKRLLSEDVFSIDIPKHEQEEFAGYCQIFNASCKHLSSPWYGIDWKHAGGCDSDFQSKFPDNCKRRPNFEVIHLGPEKTNWCGRASEYLDGSLPVDGDKRIGLLNSWLQNRWKYGTQYEKLYSFDRPKNS